MFNEQGRSILYDFDGFVSYIALPLRMQELFPIMILFSAFTKPNEKGTRVKMK